MAYVEKSCVGVDGQTLKFKTEISRSVVVQEAQRVGKSILQYQGDHPVADEYQHGGYEVERTPYGTGAAAKLIRETTALYADLKN